MRALVFTLLFSVAVPLSVSAASYPAPLSGIAACRTLRNAERVECLGKHYREQFKDRFGAPPSSSSSSSVPDPFTYPDTYQDHIGTDSTFVPEGASCVRYTDERRAACRVRQLKEGTGKSASSSTSSKVSVRRSCMRLDTAEKLKCLRESRGVIDVITRTVK